ncbi:MAG: hypothetical protein V1672_02005 [Candidatus Diapherotrites archaeon]
MGKAVPKSLKRRAEILMTEFPKEVSSDFDKNKAFLNTMELSLSKSQRNLVAGFISRKTEKPAATEHKFAKPKETEHKAEKPAATEHKFAKPITN